MRVLALAACAVVLFASDQASAACSKGLLWPYVRNPGDCLTDDEIRTGTIGAYGGAVNTSPDVSAIKVEQPAQSNAAVSAPASSNAQGSSGRGLFDQIGVTGLFGGGGSEGITPPPGTFSCNKGYLWPFLRSAGDCLTDIEKKEGAKGVYGGGSGIAPTAVGASAVTAAPAGTEAPPASGNSGAPATAGGTAPSGSTGAAECHKGLLWPFVRDTGDCPTDVEKKNGQRSISGGGSGITPTAVSASMVTAAPAATEAPAVARRSGTPAIASPAGAAECHKGLLWPFVRDHSDCTVDAEKENGENRVHGGSGMTPTPVNASTVTAAPVGTEAPDASRSSGVPATASGTPASDTTSTASCRKGLLWPFVHDAGDCPTDAQKARSR